jgi:hypothetical protein
VISANIATTKAYVGSAKSNPASRTPRRLATVSSAMNPSERLTACPSSDGTAETSARTPAATETATVRT